MLRSRWHKVINDLWGNKSRTVLIVLSIAVGLFALGTILGAQVILSTEMAKGYTAINPSTGTVRTLQTFDEGFVRSIRDMPGVAEVDARHVIYARIQVAPGEWANLTIFAIDDYDNMRVNKIWPQDGAWPPPEREILIERAALSVIRAEIGDRVVIETADEKQRIMRIAGTVHDLSQLPAQFDNSPYGYISFETLEWFGLPYGYNDLHIVASHPQDNQFSHRVLTEVKNKAEKSGLTIPMSFTAEPGQIPLEDILQAVLLLLGTLGFLSLCLSAFLIINTVSALLARQKRQIGVMKAIGASTTQIMGMYLVMVAIYGLLALSLSIPASIFGSQTLSRFMAGLFNFDLSNTHMSSEVLLAQVAIALVIPLTASIVPFLANLRITAAEAMGNFSLGKGHFGANMIDRLLSGANLWFARQVLRRSLLLSLRNTFRRKGRLLLTLATLTLAGAIFIGVFSVRASLLRSIDDLLSWWNFDMVVTFTRPYRMEEIQLETQRVSGVVETDAWLQLSVRRVRPDGSEGKPIFLFASRPGSELVPSPVITKGRWLLPGDENALVVSANLLQEEPDLSVGDRIVLKIEGKQREFRIVGTSLGILFPMAHANYPYIAQLTGNVGRADAALVTAKRHDLAYLVGVSTALENYMEHRGFRVSNIQTIAAERIEAQATFGIVIYLLLVMALLLALVGGLGLMGTMSINVLERRREIGVLRAIGAPNRGVAQVFILEGIVIGMFSWVFGVFLSIPLGEMLSGAIGIPLMGAPITFTFSMTGVWLWLALVVILSALASFVPARSASRLTVREVLAYE